MARTVGQERFLGALFGMAIGDAMGMPIAGLAAGAFEPVVDYRSKLLADGAETGAGEFTDESEIALCIVESATVNDGIIDADNIAARMRILARGESSRWMSETTLAALAASEETLDSIVPLSDDGPVTPDVAARGIPIGLLHAVGPFKPGELRADVETVVRITHGSPSAIASATAMAFVVQLAARAETRPDRFATETATFLGGGALSEALRSDASAADESVAAVVDAFRIAARAESIENAVLTAVNLGGPSDSRAATAGAIRGASDGIAAIPQRLIDTLEGRIYISLAAPWFYRAAQRRGGLVIDLPVE